MNRFISKPINLRYLNKILGFSNNLLAEKTNYSVDKEIKNLMEKIEFDYEESLELIMAYIEQVKIGIEEIKMSFEIGDFKNISIRIHQLKGASACVRIDDIKNRFEKAEELIENGDYEKMYDEIISISKNEFQVPEALSETLILKHLSASMTE